MKIAIVHNIKQSGVINRFGRLNKEMYFRDEIDAFIQALRESDHFVEEFDGDKYLLQKLEEFLPPIVQGEPLNCLVFNLAYGIQGNSRYSHIPAMLEMSGLPYTGSGPMTHGLALDKEMTKRILMQAGIPTPQFIMVEKNGRVEESLIHDLRFPVIIKPKDEAASFGISVAHNHSELMINIGKTLLEFDQDILVEEFVDGREVNVAILGNGESAEVFSPVEIDFSASGDSFQSHSGKKGGRYGHICPAELNHDLTEKLKSITKATFKVLKCNDYARVDFRLDQQMNPYVLEINSMAAIHRNGSFFHAAKNAGYSYKAMLQKMVEVAISKY